MIKDHLSWKSSPSPPFSGEEAPGLSPPEPPLLLHQAVPRRGPLAHGDPQGGLALRAAGRRQRGSGGEEGARLLDEAGVQGRGAV